MVSNTLLVAAAHDAVCGGGGEGGAAVTLIDVDACAALPDTARTRW